MAVTSSVVLLLAAAAAAAAGPLPVDKSHLGEAFHGIGGLSGGGATTRLLVDYKEPQRGDVLDWLFKKNYGASLQILKVEIGGDSQSTDGTESSHMHSPDVVDYNTGYEWWLMKEAKARNPDIKLYGLPWAYPGWVGNGTGSPFAFPELTSEYILKWVQGAKSEYDLDIDYIGIWNERSSDATYVKTLRKTLTAAGFANTKIVARDGGTDICNDMKKDADYAAAVDIIGLHYPSDFEDFSVCHGLDKPVWASEESSSYDDLNGAACWGRIITSHWVNAQITASIMWNLVGSYYHGTNWYASSMLTADQPWSGWYDVNPVVWASAHVTQFTEIGWRYLANGSGSGALPQGGYYVTLVDPAGSDFTMNIIKIDEDHAPCTRPKLPSFNVTAETVTFTLAKSMGHQGQALAVWYSNFENYTADAPMFQRLADVTPDASGSFTLDVPVGAMYTVTTVTEGPSKGAGPAIPASDPRYPLPHADDFNAVVESQEAKLWADQIGAFEAHPDADDKTNMVMRQMVPSLPIGWSDHGSNGPMTLSGMREWADTTLTTSFRLPKDVPSGAAGCVASRIDQMWKDGFAFCVYTDGTWTLSVGGPSQSTGRPSSTIAKGTTPVPVVPGRWHKLSFTVVGAQASGSLDGHSLFSSQAVRTLDTGFAGIGSNAWYHIEFDNVTIEEAGPAWVQPSAPCQAGKGTKLRARNCSTNGYSSSDLEFELLADWGLRHTPTGLCAQADSADDGSGISLQPCDPASELQQFKNDYTRIRNTVEPMTLKANGLNLVGDTTSGAVAVSGKAKWGTGWKTWCYFPNSKQLRNQYTANVGLGYPMCLSACS